jgi:hypothetical protein
VSAPFDLGAMYAQFEVAEALTLAATQRRLSHFATAAHRIALPVLLGTAATLGAVCLIAQISIHLHQAG